ncbi:MAG: hypothetical protein AAF944_27730 [Bacteroidota bacterium]
MHRLLSFNHHYSRTFLLAIMGVDALLFVGSHFVSIYLGFISFPKHLLIITTLSWWVLLMLNRRYHPNYLKSHSIVVNTFHGILVHTSLLAAICVVNKEGAYIWFLAQITSLFCIFRIVTYMLLDSIYSYVRHVTNNTLRFVIIGSKEDKVSQLLYGHLSQSEAEFVGYIDEDSVKVNDALELYRGLRRQKVSHIYCTLPLPQWTARVNKLQQIADDHFMYFHWLSDFGLGDAWKQHINFQTNSLMVYTPNKEI